MRGFLAVLASVLLVQISPTQAAEPTPDVRCGAFCLQIALESLGKAPGKFEELEKALGKPDQAGYSLARLDEVARQRGVKTIAVETSLANLLSRSEPFVCLTLIDKTHYVLLYDLTASEAFVIDYPRKYKVNRDVFETGWSRQALLIGPREFASEQSVTFWRVWRGRLLWGLWIALAAGVLLLLAWLGRLIARARGWSSVAAGLMVVLFGLASGCNPASSQKHVAASGESALVIRPATLDLGSILLTEPRMTRNVSIAIENRGDTPLHIKEIVTR